ncbi:hypothetical protein A1O3_10266 [Capronia epimyces CBS 606.96]|uniref:Transcription factor domain-containing protein n=1 Tax=Capronia epimyces CBS 606.96 TaxID=1182542 RepID=W9XA51_9EURO|nr:uncharacterized protein A1O3_10266 [Capronia epimyces CBS 606.96]EXJ77108.1 hypothetical protein A1O3_10266 [Capronia epimyces CBS 606.96]
MTDFPGFSPLDEAVSQAARAFEPIEQEQPDQEADQEQPDQEVDQEQADQEQADQEQADQEQADQEQADYPASSRNETTTLNVPVQPDRRKTRTVGPDFLRDQPPTSILSSLSPATSTESASENLYLALWYSEVSALLPPVFLELTAVMPDFPPLGSAVLAISAAYLSHRESSVVVTTRGRKRVSRYIPHKDHQYQSLIYYNTGVQGLADSFSNLAQMNPVHMLATSVLFHHFELDSGSFTGGAGHMDGIDKLLSTEYHQLNSSRTGRELLCTTMSLRALHVHRRLVAGSRFSKPIHKADGFPLNKSIINGQAGSHYDSITILLCDCMYTERRIVLDWCACRVESLSPDIQPIMARILGQMCLPESRQASTNSQLKEIDESYGRSLEQQRAQLDEWHARLPLSELPIDSFTSRQQAMNGYEDSEPDFKMHPLKFHTFESAMNYAYYAASQILSSPYVLDRFEKPTMTTARSLPFTRRHYPWEKLILRIAAGLEFADCIHKNTFRTGIMTLLTLCLLWRPRPDVAVWIDNWIRRVQDHGVPLDSGLPFLTSRINPLITQQHRNGMDVFMLSPVDTEDAEKTDLYQSDFKAQVMVCGKDRHTGELYTCQLDVP